MDQSLVRTYAATLPARRAMVDNQIRTFDVTDQALLDRFYQVPRELFLPPKLTDLAYSDAVLTVSSGASRRVQLIPMVLARLLQGASIAPNDRILVVGGGMGYAAAIVAGLAGPVVSLESDAGFAGLARDSLDQVGLSAVATATGPLADGFATSSPYDLIVVAGAVEANLDRLLAQLAPEGRLVTVQKMSFDGVRRSGKAVIHERFGSEVSVRSLFDASAPVLAEFCEHPTFVF